VLGALLAVPCATASAQGPAHAELDRRVAAVMPKVVTWRRDIHEHPELSGQEVRTAALVASHLRSLGLEVQTGVGGTGVVGVLRGGKPGPVIALRADMDALPVTEMVDLPFKSTVRTVYNGVESGVMHACGHDNHVAILMGAAEVLAGVRQQLPGTVKFIFQPAEEGMGGAAAMVRDGALANPRPDAIFGLHVWPQPAGSIGYRSGPTMAAADHLEIVVKGRQTHGSSPWAGVDPIVASAQIINALQTIVSRQIDPTVAPAVVTVGMIQGGNRGNIIPDSVVMLGTIRTYDQAMREDIHRRVQRTVEQVAASFGATAKATIGTGGLITINDAALTQQLVPSLRRAAGSAGVFEIRPIAASEDFPVFTKEIPGMFVFLGIVPPGQDPTTAPSNHSPYFFADESALPSGVRAMVEVAVDFLKSGGVSKPTP
jgi:amidohydrolase